MKEHLGLSIKQFGEDYMLLPKLSLCRQAVSIVYWKKLPCAGIIADSILIILV